MVRSICRSHGDLINRHQYLIYLALLGSKWSVSSPTKGNAVALFEWWKYVLLIR